jgi:prephenate dehydrogenase
VAIVGVGLIGGSVGLAARARWSDVRVIGIDRPEVLRQALTLGAITEAATGLEAVAAADLVVLAAPVSHNAALLEKLSSLLAPATVVTDVGSTKRDILEAARAHPMLTFVGGHPLAGAATSGVAGARQQMFRGRPWILTPAGDPASAPVERVTRFAQGLGGVCHLLDAATHDRVMAYVSHLPQVVASSLLETVGAAVGDTGLALSGPGLSDTTRLASSPPGVWTDILACNADEVGSAIDALVSGLLELRAGLGDRDRVTQTFLSAAHRRRALRLVGEGQAAAVPTAARPREIDAVRTYLEMTTPPASLVALPHDGCRLARVSGCPAAFFRFLYREVGGPWHWLDRRDWTDDEIDAYLARPGIDLRVLYCHDAPAGYAELDRAPGGDVEIVYFGLLPSFIGRGLGGPFLSAAMAAAWEGTTRRVWLHTCTLDHPAALPNYLARGFRVWKTESYRARLG